MIYLFFLFFIWQPLRGQLCFYGGLSNGILTTIDHNTQHTPTPLPRAGTCQEDTFCRLPPFRLFCSRKFPHDNSRNWLEMLNKSSNIKKRAFSSRTHLILHTFSQQMKREGNFCKNFLIKDLKT